MRYYKNLHSGNQHELVKVDEVNNMAWYIPPYYYSEKIWVEVSTSRIRYDNLKEITEQEAFIEIL